MKSQFKIIVSTENDHLDVRIAVMYRHRKIDTVHQRHYNVTENNLWLKLFDLIHGIFAICSFPHSKYPQKRSYPLSCICRLHVDRLSFDLYIFHGF